jgi:carboxyl-terminal processing protease
MITQLKKLKYLLAGASIAAIFFGLLAFQSPSIKTSKSLDIFFSFFRDLNLLYVDKVDPETLIYTGIDAMLQSLDPYSEFISEENQDEFEFQTTGEYGGMGALIQEYEGYPMIADIYEGSPAHKAGLLVGDVILNINGINVKSVPVDKASKLLKGVPKTDLKLKIRRSTNPDTLTLTFKREKIHVPSVAYQGVVYKGVGYVRLTSFTTEAYRETEKAIKELIKKDKVSSLILDLRGNPGGLLYEAVRIVNLFVPQNQLVVSTRGQVKDFDNEYKTPSSPLNTEIPLVVLVDRASASASEIVAGALQDLDRAVIIGERTFGKGLVQTTRDLPYNTKIKVTTAKYYIPSGRCIQAIDFAKKHEDGSIHFIPDSLMKPFNTLNGRTVFDGGGILPDIHQPSTSFSRFTGNLYSSRMIFNFATSYRLANQQIDSPTSFKLSQKDLEEFKAYVLAHNFNYQTQTEKVLAEVVKASKEEEFYPIAQTLIDSLNRMVKGNVLKEIEKNKADVVNMLEDEIVGRYYFQKGRYERYTKRDSLISKAIDVLSNSGKYQSILNPNTAKAN